MGGAQSLGTILRMKPFILFSILALAIGGHAKVTNGPSCYQLTDGWHKGNDGFMYRCSTEEKSFNAAQDTCKKWGGNLAMEKTQETRVYLSRMYSAKNIWCGVKRDMRTRGFRYIDGTGIKKPYWSKGGPGKENCVSHSGPNNRWKTESCSKKKLFLCQKKINYGCVKCQARAAMIQVSTPGTHVPDCNNDDSFAPLQCKGIRCWCVNKMGGMIKGTIRHKKLALDCNALRKKTTSCQIKSLTQKWLKCDPNGDFSALQCVNSKHCWCSMADGVMIPKTHHSKGQKGAPNCAKHRGLTFDCKKNLGTYSHPFEENRFIYCSHVEPYTSIVNVFSCLCPSNLIYPPGKGNFCQKPGDVPGGNPCDKDNGGCDGLCTNSGKNAVCSCPKGWQLQADKKTCNKK